MIDWRARGRNEPARLRHTSHVRLWRPNSAREGDAVALYFAASSGSRVEAACSRTHFCHHAAGPPADGSSGKVRKLMAPKSMTRSRRPNYMRPLNRHRCVFLTTLKFSLEPCCNDWIETLADLKQLSGGSIFDYWCSRRASQVSGRYRPDLR